MGLRGLSTLDGIDDGLPHSYMYKSNRVRTDVNNMKLKYWSLDSTKSCQSQLKNKGGKRQKLIPSQGIEPRSCHKCLSWIWQMLPLHQDGEDCYQHFPIIQEWGNVIIYIARWSNMKWKFGTNLVNQVDLLRICKGFVLICIVLKCNPL